MIRFQEQVFDHNLEEVEADDEEEEVKVLVVDVVEEVEVEAYAEDELEEEKVLYDDDGEACSEEVIAVVTCVVVVVVVVVVVAYLKDMALNALEDCMALEAYLKDIPFEDYEVDNDQDDVVVVVVDDDDDEGQNYRMVVEDAVVDFDVVVVTFLSEILEFLIGFQIVDLVGAS